MVLVVEEAQTLTRSLTMEVVATADEVEIVVTVRTVLIVVDVPVKIKLFV